MLIRNSIGSALILLLAQSFSLAQSDTVVDVFPLSVGNQWTYRYFTEGWAYPAGNPYEDVTDSGGATFSIVGKVISADSIRWQFQVRRQLLHHLILWVTNQDTTYLVSDTSTFELVERLTGRHQLYRNTDPGAIRTDVFPFTQGYVDTTQVFRFRRLESADSASFYSWTGPPPSLAFQSNFTFRQGLGLVRAIYNSGTVDAGEAANHYLVASIITSVVAKSGPQPSEYRLDQNYPNPFNPTTVIRYVLPQRSHVLITLFNTLGQKVGTLVDQVEEAGSHEALFNGLKLASGVYYYRLQAGLYAKTMKLEIVK